MILVTYLEELNKWYVRIQADNNGEHIQILKQIEESLGLTFVIESLEEGNVCMANSSEVRDDYKTTYAPIDILDYIYAVLHSPSYRETYKEFLKIDFPRVPYPKKVETFWQLVALGRELRQLHLLESPKVEEYTTSYPIEGYNTITRKLTKTCPVFELNVRSSLSSALKTSSVETSNLGKVWINETQYFDNVSQIAWEFYIGGYQPAQKWLNDRKGGTLDYNDILHYQKIIVALTETNRLMKKIDAIEIGLGKAVIRLIRNSNFRMPTLLPSHS